MKIRILIIAAAVVVAGVIAALFLGGVFGSPNRIDVGPPNRIVGTWEADDGAITRFNANGTGVTTRGDEVFTFIWESMSVDTLMRLSDFSEDDLEYSRQVINRGAPWEDTSERHRNIIRLISVRYSWENNPLRFQEVRGRDAYVLMWWPDDAPWMLAQVFYIIESRNTMLAYRDPAGRLFTSILNVTRDDILRRLNMEALRRVE